MLIGRKEEKNELRDALAKDEAQFIAVYGRRRVGKTFLIREAYGNDFWPKGDCPWRADAAA